MALAGIGVPMMWGLSASASDEAAAELVQEALHREIYGQQADRQRLLARALEESPDFAPAHWQQGRLMQDGVWMSVEQVRLSKREAEKLAAYEKLRGTVADSLAGHLSLADWCRGCGLELQERGHLLRVLDMAPDHEPTRNRLGYRLLDGEWYTGDEASLLRARQAVQQQAWRRWQPEVVAIRDGLLHADPDERQQSERRLRAIDDTGAIRAMEAILSVTGEAGSLLVLDVVARMQGPEAVASLIRHAVLSPSFVVQEDAARRLSLLPREQYVPDMLAEMYSPVVTTAYVEPTSRGATYRQAFAREARDENQVLVVDTAFRFAGRGGADDRFPLQRALQGSAETSAWLVGQQNLRTQVLNARIAAALNMATGQQLPAEPRIWWQWWLDQNDTVLQGSKQTRVRQDTQQVRLVDPSGQRSECFAAGTPVVTATGTKAIEQLRTGDVVLAKHVETGELAYKPVIRVTIRPAEPLVNVQVAQETLSMTGGHLLWVSGSGWRKARDLTSGMNLHTVTGSARVIDVLPALAEPTYNLVVADFSTYFVGSARLLSHDVTEQRPSYMVVPGLADE